MVERGDTDRIKELLGQHRNGLTIDEVSRHLGINRSTASKYLNLLVSSGAATIRKLGPAKLFYLKERVPVNQLLNCTYDGIIIVDGKYGIHYINDVISTLFGIGKESVIGSVALQTPLAPLFDPETQQFMGDSLTRKGHETRGTVRIGEKTFSIRKCIIPVQFESGSTGYCLICHFDQGQVEQKASGLEKALPDMALYTQYYQLDALIRRYAKNQVTIALDILKRMEETRDPARFRELSGEQEEVLKAILVHLRIFDEFLEETPPRQEWVPLEEVTGNALSLVRLSHVRFFSDIRGIEIFADRSFCRVFQTLLENSVVHGKKVTSVRVTAQETKEGLSIVYEDDGTGIPDSEKPSLFEWGHGLNRAHSLFLSRQVLAANGMSIKETGIFNRGARFEILVPPGRYRVSRE
jgi:PAS domain-containing protein